MQAETKKIGELLVEAGLISEAQLQEALRQQRIAGGRMGSNLVALGFVDEEVLMDFLAQKTGVPRLDTTHVDVPLEVLKRIPRRLAEQFNLLPVAFKEPKTLVLAMADPSDLNAIDSARFASGLHVDPVVAAHTAIRHLIAEQYRKVESATPRTVEVGGNLEPDAPLPVSVAFETLPDPRATGGFSIQAPAAGAKSYGKDPFFSQVGGDGRETPFSFFDADATDTLDLPTGISPEQPMVIPSRGAQVAPARRLESFQTRTLVLGLIRMLQRRGILGEDELQRFLINLIDAGELKDDDRFGF